MANGSVFKRGDTWSYTIDVGPDPTTGKRRQKKKGGFKTQREAQAAKNIAASEVARGTYVVDTKQTLADYLVEDWLPSKHRRVSENSCAHYTGVVTRYIVPTLGTRRLGQVRAQHLEAAYGHLLDRGGRKGRPLSVSTVQQTHRVVRAALEDAVRWGLLATNPVRSAKPPVDPSGGKIMRWSAEELKSFLTSQEGDRLHALWWTLGHTGLRRGEALGLQWADLDLDARALSVNRSRSTTRSRAEDRAPKTEASYRTIALTNETVTILRSWKATQTAERLRHGPAYEPSPYVFTKAKGGPLDPNSTSTTFRRRVSALEGLSLIRLHGLRHTHASLVWESSRDVKALQQRMGHGDVAMTLRTYVHITPDIHRSVADELERYLAQ